MIVNIFATYRDRYQYQILQIVESFESLISPSLTFKDSNEKEEFISQKVLDLESKFPDSQDEAYGEACALMEFRKHSEYQYLCYTASLLFHTFEQQLIQVFYNDLVRGAQLKEKLFGKFFSYGTGILKLIEATNTVWWDFEVLKELQHLNNAVKHGRGDSFKKIRNQYPQLLPKEYLQDDIPELLQFRKNADNTLLEEIIQISIEDLKRYSKTIIEFWQQFPYDLSVEIKDQVEILRCSECGHTKRESIIINE